LTANIPKDRRLGAIPRKVSPTNEAYVLGGRGRGHNRSHSSDSRSSSSDSLYDRRDDGDDSRQYSRRVPPSPFDARARQRAGPVDPPSSWSGRRPAPASRRRRSDAGGSNYGGSDNEVSFIHQFSTYDNVSLILAVCLWTQRWPPSNIQPCFTKYQLPGIWYGWTPWSTKF
jgi:hypothetical protein